MAGTEMPPIPSSKLSSSRGGGSERGWYLLEYAVVVFGVAVFIVGLSDISRIFHARGAVRAGVTEGLRCLYPTDAGCSDQNLNSGWFPTDRFNARIAGDQTNKFELPRISFNLTSGWFNEPVSEAPFATKQLTSVTLTQPEDAFRQYQVLFPGTAHAVYLLKTQELPRVAPGASGSARERILNPRFFDPESGSVRAANKELDIPSLSFYIRDKDNNPRNGADRVEPGETGGSFVQSFTVNVSDVFPDAALWSNLKALEAAHRFTAPCYQGTKTTLPGGGAGIAWPPAGAPAACAYRADPTALYTGTNLKVPIMIHVAGAGYISPRADWPEWEGVFGQVELKLFQGGVEIADLGGREFGRSDERKDSKYDRQEGNFVVRGAGYSEDGAIDVTDSYVEHCKAADYSECRNYITMPLITVGQPVELRFRLIWRKGADAKRSNPNVNISWQSGNVRIFHPRFSVAQEQRSCGYSPQPNSCSASVAPMQPSFTTTNLDQAFSYSERTERKCDRSVPPGHQPSIPAALEAFRGEIQSGARQLQPIAFWSHGATADRCEPKRSQAPCTEKPREHMKGCEPEYSFPGEAEALCTLNDYQPHRDTISNPKFEYEDVDRVETRGACTGEPFPECAQKHLNDKSPAFLGAVSNGCAAALPVSVEPFNTGPLFKNTCVDELAGFVEKYREDNDIPPSIGVGTIVKQEKPVISPEKPTNRCIEHSPISGPPGESWLCAERASYAVANNCCRIHGEENCSIEPIAMGSGGGENGGFDQIVEGAVERTFETVQAAYPPVKMDLTCGQTPDGAPSEDGCIDIQAGPADNGTRARVQASMRVPLALFGWLGMEDHAVVQYEETRTLESSLAGEMG
jgi:hypothetical protein